MSTARWEHTLTLLQNGQVLAVGGSPNLNRGTAPVASAEIYSQ